MIGRNGNECPQITEAAVLTRAKIRTNLMQRCEAVEMATEI